MPACITAQGNAMPSYAAGKWCANVYHSVASGASYEGVYYLSIHENGLVEINDVIVSIDAPLQIAGYCTYLGTTELGMVYQFGPSPASTSLTLPRAATPSLPGCNAKQTDMVFLKRVPRFF